MIVVYPFSPVDQELALKNAQWIRDLGGCKAHECLMIADKRCHNIQQVQDVLIEAFGKVYPLIAGAEIDGWPEGANYFFRTATAKLQSKPDTPYFMWMEPDAIPLEPQWLDKLEAEYKRFGRPFMGDRVQVENIPVHMSGVGIYPNPLHQYSGEAYRAHDVAWDMAGAGQIVPQAHFTDLIEHAWKHPSFTSHAELATQIANPTILFHASKDGSLIDLLRSASAETGKETTSPASSARIGPIKDREEPRSPSLNSAVPVCDIFIRTHEKDYPWLEYCLESIGKYANGFRKVWVVSPNEAPVFLMGFRFTTGNFPIPITFVKMNDECEDGYLAQQVTKLYADVITDYQPDYILHVDSDVVFTHDVTPQDFLYADRVLWFYTPYDQIETPWQPITEKFMDSKVDFEFMRRFPIMVPRWLYPRIREFCYRKHGMTITDYIRIQPSRAFSEFNVMGAYAHKFHFDKFAWCDTMGDEFPLIPPRAKQFRSWEGITPEVRTQLSNILGGVSESPTPTAGAVPLPGGAALPPAGIEELDNGLWIIKGDTHVSQWVKIQRRLDHDQNSLPDILPLIKPGDVVIDAGAFIGDHTIAYLKAVGESGKVYAFEPNPIAFQCLMHNITGHDTQLHPVMVALGDHIDRKRLSGNNGNAAGAYIGDHQSLGLVDIVPLDQYHLNPNFIKWDIEGYEVKALIGAQETIKRCHPIMVMEVNVTALARQGATVGQLFALLESHGYTWKVMQENCSEFDLMYDIICTPPQKSPEVSSQGNGEQEAYRCASPPPPVSPPDDATKWTEVDPVKAAVQVLKDYATSIPTGKSRVMTALYYAGLTTKKTKKKKHETVRAVPDHQTKTAMEAPPAASKSGKSKRAGRNNSRRLVSATPKEQE